MFYSSSLLFIFLWLMPSCRLSFIHSKKKVLRFFSDTIALHEPWIQCYIIIEKVLILAKFDLLFSFLSSLATTCHPIFSCYRIIKFCVMEISPSMPQNEFKIFTYLFISLSHSHFNIDGISYWKKILFWILHCRHVSSLLNFVDILFIFKIQFSK